MNKCEKYDQLRSRVARIADLTGTLSLLSWDQETMMPRGGTESRAHQMGTLAGLIHEHYTDPKLGELLETLTKEIGDCEYSSVEASAVRVMLREFTQRTRIPHDLVIRRTELSAKAREVWKKARAGNDFASYAPFLRQQFELARAYADALGYEKNPYDALLDAFESGTTFSWIDERFRLVKPRLQSLIGRIDEAKLSDASHARSASITHRHVDPAVQLAFSRKMATVVGYDFEHGRLDLSTHPFTSGSSYFDVRLTTRVDENYFPSCLFATIHEAGHGIHGQRLDPDLYRLPFRYGLAVAESQSRLYENMIGRSRAFWEFHYDGLQRDIPDFADVDLDTWYRAINAVGASLIRVEADEVTYGMHIMLRFELENALINGEIAVNDLPDEWNARMESYLGVRPDTDANGVLQDIHWSQGGIGYFPDYLLGSMLSAQLWEKLSDSIQDADKLVAQGELSGINEWLSTTVQSQGGKFTLTEIAERATGREFSGEPYMAYLEKKYGEIYLE